MKRAIVIVLGTLFLLLFLLPTAASRTSLGAVLTWLPVGWFFFLQRNLPQLSTNWSLIGMVLICSAILLLFGHWLLRSLFKQQPMNASSSQPLRWHFGWTLSVYAGIWLLFIIVFGASGLYRQITWLSNEEHPWYEERLNYFSELRSASGALQLVMLDTEENLEKTHSAMVVERTRRNKPLFEQFDVLLYANAQDKVEAYILIPRSPKLLGQGRFALVELPDGYDFDRRISDLRRTIAMLDAKYPKKRS